MSGYFKNFKSLKALGPYLKPFLWILLVSALLGIPLAALRSGPVPLVKYFIDELLVNRDAAKLLIFPLIIVGIYLLNLLVRFTHMFLNRLVVARVHQKIKNNLYAHLLGLSADYYTKESTGSLISRVGTDPQHIDGSISAINTLVREPFTFVFLFGAALYLNWELTLITLIIFPFLAWLFSFTGKALKRYIHKMQEENAQIFSRMQETFTGIRVVKLFRLEKYAQAKFQDRVKNYTRVSVKTAAVQEASHPIVDLLTAIAISGVIYYGGNLVIANKMSQGDLMAFFVAFALMMDPIRKLNDVNIKIANAAGAMDRISEILGWKTHILESANPKKLDRFENEVRFQNVSFSYPDEPTRPVVQNLDFVIPKDQAVALVGASGSGKSSVASLLARLFDVRSGEILIDGINVKDLSTTNLRRLISVVSQDVFLFNDTIEENIRCGRLDATSEEIHQAAKLAHAYDFIQSFPEGFRSVIGDRGQKLSGGERQRISIARAFLSNAPILILDEATSSLDSGSEKVVQEAINSLMKDKTTLIIAHRLSTIRDCHEIIVLKDGRIVEMGNHGELVKKDGEYARFQRLHSEMNA